MKKQKTAVALIALAVNFGLFLIKLYVGISSNSLSIYCDCINNLLDSVSCVIALITFHNLKSDDLKAKRAESLTSFVISVLICLAGIYFVYNGLQRILYPVPIAYSVKYAVLIGFTAAAKIVLYFACSAFYRKTKSDVVYLIKTDSALDSLITITTLAGLLLSDKVNLAFDGWFAIAVGSFSAVVAIRETVKSAKFLINS